MYAQTVKDTTCLDYPIQYITSPSTGIEEIDKSVLQEILISFNESKRFTCKTTLSQFVLSS